MHRDNGTTPNHHTGSHHSAPVARSYSEIARILAEREGASISPAEVEQMCHAAEKKLAHAIRSDPVIDQWLVTGPRVSAERPSVGVEYAAGHGSSEEY